MYWITRNKIAAPTLSRPPFNLCQRRRNGPAGFTLVEVVIAMGIVVVALIPLLGLMPMGLNTSRQAIDTTIQAQIVQHMTGLAQETDFSNLAQLNNNSGVNNTLEYFDAYGNFVTTTNTATYMAAFSNPVTPGTPANPAGATLPTGTTLPGGQVTYQLTTISIYILNTRTPGSAAIMASSTPVTSLTNAATTNPLIHKYTFFVPNNGH